MGTHRYETTSMSRGINKDNAMNAELKAWIRDQLDAAVQTFNAQQIFDDPFVESRPAWVLPMRILIGKARAQSDPLSYKWFICGDAPFGHIDSASATTPRDALRHFSMKLQMEANSLDGDAATLMIKKAEDLYDLTEDDLLWSE